MYYGRKLYVLEAFMLKSVLIVLIIWKHS